MFEFARPLRRRPLLAAGLAAPAALLAWSVALPAADDCVLRTDLVANDAGSAPNADPNLRNPWGVAFVKDGYVWVADNRTGYATAYDGAGVPQPSPIAIPAAGGAGTGSPTGVVANATPDFLELGAVPAQLLFCTEDGLIAAWHPSVDGTTARVVQDLSATGADFKGLAIANDGRQSLLFAADFHNGRIAVFDRTLAPVESRGGFRDRTLPRGFAPFNVQNVGGALYVAYARQDAVRADESAGRGLGVVNVFDANGYRLRRFAARGRLNAPWAVTQASRAFGSFSDRLLVGNFGDGTIQTYDLESGRPRGALRGADGRPLAVEGLWGLAFGNGEFGASPNTLYFAAGVNDEQDGAYGALTPTQCVVRRRR